jgi:hypothetical protein
MQKRVFILIGRILSAAVIFLFCWFTAVITVFLTAIIILREEYLSAAAGIFGAAICAWITLRWMSRAKASLFGDALAPTCRTFGEICRGPVLLVAIAAAPHAVFLGLWQSSPANTQPWLGSALKDYEQAVYNLHQRLEYHFHDSGIWWACLILTIGWISIRWSRPGILDRSILAKSIISRIVFLVLIASYFTATTSVPHDHWDPHVKRRLQLVLSNQMKGHALREVAQAVSSELAHAQVQSTLPPPMSPCKGRRYVTPVSAEQINCIAYTPGMPSPDQVLGRLAPESLKRDIQKEVRNLFPAIPVPDAEENKGESELSSMKGLVDVYRKESGESKKLNEEVSVKRKAAVEALKAAFVKMPEFKVTNTELLDKLFNEIIQSSADAIYDRFMEGISNEKLANIRKTLNYKFVNFLKSEILITIRVLPDKVNVLTSKEAEGVKTRAERAMPSDPEIKVDIPKITEEARGRR